ncbi:MAG TPA: hypothetical protein VMF30_00210, partial [Pirellulales bacterium]|nr:hypothetical protein [Pirellulales bacterium]
MCPSRGKPRGGGLPRAIPHAATYGFAPVAMPDASSAASLTDCSPSLDPSFDAVLVDAVAVDGSLL